MLAAFAGIRAGQPEVHHITLIEIIDHTHQRNVDVFIAAIGDNFEAQVLVVVPEAARDHE